MDAAAGTRQLAGRALHKTGCQMAERGRMVVFNQVYKSFLTLSAMARQLVSPGLSMFSRLIHP